MCPLLPPRPPLSPQTASHVLTTSPRRPAIVGAGWRAAGAGLLPGSVTADVTPRHRADREGSPLGLTQSRVTVVFPLVQGVCPRVILTETRSSGIVPQIPVCGIVSLTLKGQGGRGGRGVSVCCLEGVRALNSMSPSLNNPPPPPPPPPTPPSATRPHTQIIVYSTLQSPHHPLPACRPSTSLCPVMGSDVSSFDAWG